MGLTIESYVKNHRHLSNGDSFTIEGVKYNVRYAGATVIVIVKAGKGRHKEIIIRY